MRMIIRDGGKLFEVQLEDDGSLDTVISVQPVAPRKRFRNAPNDSEYYPRQEFRFSQEYAAGFRRPSGELTAVGFQYLAHEAAQDYEFPEDK
jgi:hypothetical protein